MFSEAFSGGDDDVSLAARTLEIIKSPPWCLAFRAALAHKALGARPLVARHAKLIPLIIF